MTENRYRGGKAVHKAGGRDNGVYLWVETKYHEKQKRSISYKDNG